MKVRDIMTRDVVTIDPEASFPEMARRLLDARVSGAPVVDPTGRVIGIISESDLIPKEAMRGVDSRRPLALLTRLFSERDARWTEQAEGIRAEDVMTRDVVSTTPEEPVERAARSMLHAGLRRLPVVEDGHLVGIVARADILRVLSLTDDALREQVEALLRRCFWVPPDDRIRVQARDGVVTLAGHVRYESDVRVVEAVVASSPGVVAVDNALTFMEHDPRRVPV